MKNQYQINHPHEFANYLTAIFLSDSLNMENGGGCVFKDQKFELQDEHLDVLCNEDLKEYIISNLESFNKCIEKYMSCKIKYLIAEGYMKEEKDRYVFFTDQEIQKTLDDLAKS